MPVPAVGSLAALNQLIAAADMIDDGRVITGRPVTVAAAFADEQLAMLPLPDEPFDPARLLQEVVGQCFRQGQFAKGVGIALSLDDQQVRAQQLADGIDAARESAPEKAVDYALASTEMPNAFVESIPAEFAQPVLTSAARALVDAGSFDWLPDLLERVIKAGIVAPEDDATGCYIAMAEVLADTGETGRSRNVMADVGTTLRDLSADDEPMLFLGAAHVLDKIGNFDTAEKLLLAIGNQSKNRSYALSDHAALLASAGDTDRALNLSAQINMPITRASCLSRIAAALALGGGSAESAERAANDALHLVQEYRDGGELARRSA